MKDLESVLKSHQTINLLSYNIDTNKLYYETHLKTLYSNWCAEKRIILVQQEVAKIMAEKVLHILHFQECRRIAAEKDIDTITPLREFLEDKGYEVIDKEYNTQSNNSGANEPNQPFHYISAYRKDTFHTFYSELREFSNDCNTQYRSSCFMMRATHRDSEKTVISLNVHVTIDKVNREKVYKAIADYATQLLEKDPGAMMLIAGDFNTFDSKSPFDCTSTNTSKLRMSTPKPRDARGAPDFTFIPFPYDLVRHPACNEEDFTRQKEIIASRLNDKEIINDKGINALEDLKKNIVSLYMTHCRATTSILDWAFGCSNFHAIESQVLICPLYSPLKDYAEDTIRSYVIDNIDKGPAFASDHQPLLVTATFSKGKSNVGKPLSC